MNGIELNRRIREILETVTPETILSSSMAITELGIGVFAAFHLVEAILRARMNLPKERMKG